MSEYNYEEVAEIITTYIKIDEAYKFLKIISREGGRVTSLKKELTDTILDGVRDLRCLASQDLRKLLPLDLEEIEQTCRNQQ